MSDEMRILVLTANAGFGHRSAAEAVAGALTERYGEFARVEIANPLDDKRVPSMLRESQADYDKLVRSEPKLYNLGYDLSDAPFPAAVMDSALTLMLLEALRHLVKQTQPDAIVTTYPLYQAPLRAVFQVRRRRVPLATVVTDLATVHTIWFHDAADLCLVPTTKVRDLALKHGMRPDRVKVTGIPVDIALSEPVEDQAALRAELGWEADLVTLLAVGSKRAGHMHDVIRVLNHCGLPFQLAVVAGGDDALYAEFEKMTWHVPVHLYSFVDNVPAMMRAADAIICKAGGLIVSEALAAGLPVLLVDVLPGQEEGNAAHVVESGAGVWARDPILALETIYDWLADDAAALVEVAARARATGRPAAAFDVAERVVALARSGVAPGGEGHRPGERSRLVAWLQRNIANWQEED